MKVPPKRKGNQVIPDSDALPGRLNESPSEKEGKLALTASPHISRMSLNESPSEKEGKCRRSRAPALAP